MPYQNNIPQPGDQISVSQGDILGNFVAIGAGFSQNHIPLTGAALQAGQHNFIQLFPRAATPGALFAGSPGFWADNTADKSVFLHNESTGADINISKSGLGVDGWCWLPSGVLLKWGTFQSTAVPNTDHFFPVAAGIPAFTHIRSVQVTASRVGVGTQYLHVFLNTYTNLLLNVTGWTFATPAAPHNVVVNYFCIGT